MSKFVDELVDAIYNNAENCSVRYGKFAIAFKPVIINAEYEGDEPKTTQQDSVEMYMKSRGDMTFQDTTKYPQELLDGYFDRRKLWKAYTWWLENAPVSYFTY